MKNRTAILLIALALTFYALWAGSAIRSLSPTADEPLHVIGAWNVRFEQDYRPNREDPPLWHWWIGMFLDRDDVKLSYTPAMWAASRYGADPQDAYFNTLRSRAEAVSYTELVRKGRVAMLGVAVLLGAAIAWGTWALVGKRAAVFAAVLFSLEPLILGHGILVKNDIAFALFFFVGSVSFFQLSCNRHWGWSVVFIAVSAAGMATKFSGLLWLFAVVPALLAVRVIMAGEWKLGSFALSTWPKRLLGAVVLYGLTLLVTWGLIWTVYSFRFEPNRTGDRFDFGSIIDRTASIELTAKYAAMHPGRDPDPAFMKMEAPKWQPSLFVKGVLFAHSHKLLPEAMCAGMIFTYASTQYRPAFLLGQYSDLGFWYYFPVAWLVKTPLVVIGLTVGAMAYLLRQGRWKATLLLLVPPGLYLLSAMGGKLNIGLRHLSPVYPFILLGGGMMLSLLWEKRRWVAVVAVVLLAAEVLTYRGMYIQYFNLAAGGTRGGLRILSDSNLDWGQDLPRLLAWKKQHPDERIFLNYFGVLDPGREGLKYQNLSGSWAPGQTAVPQSGDVVAISATHLQGTYFYAELRKEMEKWRAREPIEVLGGTIYLYRMP